MGGAQRSQSLGRWRVPQPPRRESAAVSHISLSGPPTPMPQVGVVDEESKRRAAYSRSHNQEVAEPGFLGPGLPDGKRRAFSMAGDWDVNDGRPFPSPPTPSANWTFPLGGPPQGGLMSQEAKPQGGRQEALTQLSLRMSAPEPRWPWWCQPLMPYDLVSPVLCCPGTAG